MHVFTQTGALRARWSVLMVLTVAIALVVVGLVYTGHVQGQFRCQARYNTAFQERSKALARVANEDRQLSTDADNAIARLITDAIKANGDRKAGQEAARRYLTETKRIAQRRAELDRERKAHPFPQVPEKACA